jgi:hypothetical protein
VSSSLHISINSTSSTTNGETTGSTKIDAKINNNDFGDIFDKCLENGEVEVDENGAEIECEYDDGTIEVDFESDKNTRTKNKVKFDTYEQTRDKHSD